MKLKPGYEDYCYSLIDSGFWYNLTEYPPKTPDDLHLESEEDAQRVMDAISVLEEYFNLCEEEAEKLGDV